MLTAMVKVWLIVISLVDKVIFWLVVIFWLIDVEHVGVVNLCSWDVQIKAKVRFVNISWLEV